MKKTKKTTAKERRMDERRADLLRLFADAVETGNLRVAADIQEKLCRLDSLGSFANAANQVQLQVAVKTPTFLDLTTEERALAQFAMHFKEPSTVPANSRVLELPSEPLPTSKGN